MVIGMPLVCLLIGLLIKVVNIYHKQKALMLMERLFGSSFVKLACFIVHQDAHIVPFATIVLIALIIIAHGSDSVLAGYASCIHIITRFGKLHYILTCIMISNCLFQRNYRSFFIFVSSTAFLCLYVFSMCWVNIIMTMQENSSSLLEALIKSPVSGMLITYTFTVSWFVGGLSAFHLYLVITNQVPFSSSFKVKVR